MDAYTSHAYADPNGLMSNLQCAECRGSATVVAQYTPAPGKPYTDEIPIRLENGQAGERSRRAAIQELLKLEASR